MIKLLLAIGTGSFAGGIARFLLSRSIQGSVLSSFPYGTFVVNILGCLLIGIFYGVFDKGANLSTGWKMFLTVGFCGGFTTFSAFANENYAMLKDGNIVSFALYTGLSVFLGVLAVYFGNLMVKFF